MLVLAGKRRGWGEGEQANSTDTDDASGEDRGLGAEKRAE